MNKKITKDTTFRILLSVALAFLLWIFAMTNTDPMLTQKYSSIPIEFQNMESINSNNLSVESSIEKIDIKLYGRTIQVSKIKASDIEAVADLSNITKEGTYTVEVIIKGLPQNVNVIDISPRYITVEVSRTTQEKSNFTIEISGYTASGHAFLGYTADISNVTLTGSEIATSKVSQIKGTVDISGKTKDFSSIAALSAYDINGEKITNVTLIPSKVTVSVSVGLTKTVDVTAVSSGTCATGYALEKITLNPAQITIGGKEDVLNKIAYLPTDAIDITNKNSSFTTEITISAPPGITLVGQRSVSADVSIQAFGTITFKYDTLQVRNTPAGMSCDLSAFTGLNMTVQGFTKYLSTITKDSIAIYIDLSDLTAGAHTVIIKYDLPTNVTVKTIDKTNVSIILSTQ